MLSKHWRMGRGAFGGQHNGQRQARPEQGNHKGGPAAGPREAQPPITARDPYPTPACACAASEPCACSASASAITRSRGGPGSSRPRALRRWQQALARSVMHACGRGGRASGELGGQADRESGPFWRHERSEEEAVTPQASPPPGQVASPVPSLHSLPCSRVASWACHDACQSCCCCSCIPRSGWGSPASAWSATPSRCPWRRGAGGGGGGGGCAGVGPAGRRTGGTSGGRAAATAPLGGGRLPLWSAMPGATATAHGGGGPGNDGQPHGTGAAPHRGCMPQWGCGAGNQPHAPGRMPGGSGGSGAAPPGGAKPGRGGPSASGVLPAGRPCTPLLGEPGAAAWD
jgi:hypothetical protein